jgi:putative endonuclease
LRSAAGSFSAICSPLLDTHSSAVRSHDLGRRSEDIACDYLRARGWRIIARNFRSGHKEVDIIAGLGHTVAFVEVKARARTDCGHPLHAITWAKRREIAHVARAWLGQHAIAGAEYRFDAIAITWCGSSHVLEHVQNAWALHR